MSELIKVNNEEQTVSARELHGVLEIKSKYIDWFNRMCSYGFELDVDYKAIAQKKETAQGNESTYIEHEINVDMAKQICMIQRTEKGKKLRQYFIDLEKAWNTPEQIMARALSIAEKTINELKIENKEMKPKAIFADSVSASKTSILIGQLAKLIKQNGKEIGQNRLFKWMRDNGYLCKSGESYNMPTQYSMNLELMEVKENSIVNTDGSVRITRTTKITGKGQQYFVNKLLDKNY